MNPEITSLAQGTAATLITLMTTDAWNHAREGIIQLWRRIQPERAEIVTAELEASREDVLTAYTNNDQETLNEVHAQWQNWLKRLLAARPEAADDLRRLLDELDPSGTAATPAVTQNATASGQARIYQAGRDQHIQDR